MYIYIYINPGTTQLSIFTCTAVLLVKIGSLSASQQEPPKTTTSLPSGRDTCPQADASTSTAVENPGTLTQSQLHPNDALGEAI